MSDDPKVDNAREVSSKVRELPMREMMARAVNQQKAQAPVPGIPTVVFLLKDVNGKIVTCSGDAVLESLHRHNAMLYGANVAVIPALVEAYYKLGGDNPITIDKVKELTAMATAIIAASASGTAGGIDG